MHNSDFRYFKIPDSTKNSLIRENESPKKNTSKSYLYIRVQAPNSALNSSSWDYSKWLISFLKMLKSKQPDRNFFEMLEPIFLDNHTWEKASITQYRFQNNDCPVCASLQPPIRAPLHAKAFSGTEPKYIRLFSLTSSLKKIECAVIHYL